MSNNNNISPSASATTARRLLLVALALAAGGASALPTTTTTGGHATGVLAARHPRNAEMAAIVILSSVGVMVGGMLVMLLVYGICRAAAALVRTAPAPDPSKAGGYPPPMMRN